jgi:iron complex transport system permease protein
MALAQPVIHSINPRSRALARAGWIAGLAVLALVVAAASLLFGTVELSAGTIASALIHPHARDLAHTILWDIRLPRMLIGVCVGAGLGIAGAMLQMVFRNPLVDPYLTGVSAGAAVAAAIGIAIGVSFVIVPALAFGGGLACAALVAVLGAGTGQTGNLRLVLSGTAISALCAAIVTIVLLRGEGSSGLSILGWLAGGISGRGWVDLQWSAAYLVAGVIGAVMLAPALNALRLGSDAAAGLGLRVERARLAVLAAAALITADSTTGSMPGC